MGTNTPHTCIPGLVWQKQASRFSQFELKVGGLGFPIHFVCVSAALYHRGNAAAIFPLELRLSVWGPVVQWLVQRFRSERLRVHHASSQPLQWSERSLPCRMKFVSRTTPNALLYAGARPNITMITGPVLSGRNQCRELVSSHANASSSRFRFRSSADWHRKESLCTI